MQPIFTRRATLAAAPALITGLSLMATGSAAGPDIEITFLRRSASAR